MCGWVIFILVPKHDLLSGWLSVTILEKDHVSSLLFLMQHKALPKPSDAKHQLQLAFKKYGLISDHEYSELRACNTVIW